MSNFVDNMTSLPTGKSDLVAVPSGQGAYYVAAAEWQTAMQALLDLRGYSWRAGGNDGAKGATGGGGGTVPYYTLPAGTDLLLTGSNNNTRDNPLNSVAFQNTGITNNPIIRHGNPYLAGIGLAATGFWYSDDTMVSGGVRTWKIFMSWEKSGTAATVLDGVERSAYESFIQNGDFKPWMRAEASSRGINFGGGGCKATAGNVVRTGGSTVTVTTVNPHRFSVGDALWRTQDPYTGNVSDLTLFGAEATSGSNVTVVSTPAYNVFTYTLSGTNGASAGGILYSSETDVTFGRDATGIAAIRSLGTTMFQVGQDGSGPAQGKNLALRGPVVPLLWYNGGGDSAGGAGVKAQLGTGLPAMIVGTGAGTTDHWCYLPDIASFPMFGICRVKNEGKGLLNDLAVRQAPTDSGTTYINSIGAAFTLAADTWADFQKVGSGDWAVYKGDSSLSVISRIASSGNATVSVKTTDTTAAGNIVALSDAGGLTLQAFGSTSSVSPSTGKVRSSHGMTGGLQFASGSDSNGIQFYVSNGSAADTLAAQIDPVTYASTWQGQMIALKNIQLGSTGTGAKPSASSVLRGLLWVTQSASGTADSVDVCLKSAADTYSWKNITTG